MPCSSWEQPGHLSADARATSILHQSRQLCPRSTNIFHSGEEDDGCGVGGVTLGLVMIFSTCHGSFKAGGGCLQQAPSHIRDDRRALLHPAMATFPELTFGQSYWLWHKAWGRRQSRTWHEDEGLGMGQGGHPCFLVETTASHFNPIPLLALMKGQQVFPFPQ